MKNQMRHEDSPFALVTCRATVCLCKLAASLFLSGMNDPLSAENEHLVQESQHGACHIRWCILWQFIREVLDLISIVTLDGLKITCSNK